MCCYSLPLPSLCNDLKKTELNLFYTTALLLYSLKILENQEGVERDKCHEMVTVQLLTHKPL